MENKKVYKIRKKGTQEFLSLGYNSKRSWAVYPSEALKYSPKILAAKEDYEIVIFEYELKETKTIELK